MTGSSCAERGSVTAEIAVAMPVVVLLLSAALWSVAAAADRVRCVDAARDAALGEARGDSRGLGGSGDRGERDPGESSGNAVDRQIPVGGRVVVRRGELIEATCTVRRWPLGRWGPEVEISATVKVAPEPGAEATSVPLPAVGVSGPVDRQVPGAAA
jgi:hypothetical protein